MTYTTQFIWLLLVLTVSCSSTTQPDDRPQVTHTVTWSQSEIDAAGIKPGDVVVVKSGTYTDEHIKINVRGTENAPVIFKAEKAGKVIVTGASSLSIGGSYITVSGIHFKDCDISDQGAVFSFRTGTKEHAFNSRLTDCVISGSGLPYNKDKNPKWVSVYGSGNEVDQCSFIDKTDLGSLLVVWVDPDVISDHRIHHNYFTHPFSLEEGGSSINGQEMIRIGTSDVSMSVARCSVYDNYFYRCDGEIEVISNKSCENSYTNNVFDQCVGMLTLRHGNRCVVDGNYFFGGGVRNTGGVRIIGEDHRVYNNYFEQLGGEDSRAAISLIRGVENSALNEYFQVKNAEVTFNTIVNCKNGIVVNTGKSTSTMPVISSIIAGNLIMDNTGGSPGKGIINITTPAPQVDWSDNYLYGTTVSGMDAQSNDSYTFVPQFDLEKSNGIYTLQNNVPAVYSKISSFGYVTTDITGAVRPQAKTPGASEPGSAPARLIPTKDSTGATWKPNL